MTKPDKRRTHKRQWYTHTPQVWEPDGTTRPDPNCNGTGSRFGKLCPGCGGSGVWQNTRAVRTGPDERRETSLCSNTGYTTDPKLTDSWDRVDCPACLALLWASSPASKAKLRYEANRVTDAVAVILPVIPCHPYLTTVNHGAHIWHSDAAPSPYRYCPGGKANPTPAPNPSDAYEAKRKAFGGP